MARPPRRLTSSEKRRSLQLTGKETYTCLMWCAEYDALWQEHQAAATNFYESICALAVLVDHLAPDSDFNLAHRRIRANLRACQAARDALERHQEEHECLG